MTRAALLTFLTLCYAGVSLVDAEKQTVATCTVKEGEIKVQSTPLEAPGEIVVSCPKEAATIKPEGADAAGAAATCYVAADMKTTGKLGEMIRGATCQAEAVKDGKPGEKQLKLAVLQLPKEAVSLYFYCEKAKAGGAKEAKDEGCLIEVKVAASPELGPNTCAVDNTEIVFRLSKPNEPARFSCGREATLFPEGLKKAYDSSCSNPAALSDDIVVSLTNGSYEVVQRKLLSSAQELCFYCAKKNATERCIVRVHVAGGGEGAATMSASSRAASALGLALVVASCLYFN